MINILYCCFNNYDLLIGENRDFLQKYKDNIILVDDHSSADEFKKGELIANQIGLKFALNPGKGLQEAVDFCSNEYCSNDDWILVLQQDVYFKDSNAIENITSRAENICKKKINVGAFGFPNYIPKAHYHNDVINHNDIEWKNTWLGVFFLSDSFLYKTHKIKNLVFRWISRFPFVENIERRFWQKVIFHRNFSPLTFPNFSHVVSAYEGFSVVDLPVWTAVMISVKAWKESVKKDPNFIFHLWFPDVAMQLMNNNFYVCLDTSEVVINNWRAKEEYGHLDSVTEGKLNTGKMEQYGKHLQVWKLKWGFDYENPFAKKLKKVQKGSVLEEMILKKTLKSPKNFEID